MSWTLLGSGRTAIQTPRTASNADTALEILQEIEEAWDDNYLQETDKAWDAIHQCLAGSLDDGAGKYPLNHCVLGGKQILDGYNWIGSLVRPDQVPDVAKALAPITREWLHNRFFALTTYEGPHNDDDFEYTWDYFVETRKFYEKTASECRAVVFFVDL